MTLREIITELERIKEQSECTFASEELHDLIKKIEGFAPAPTLTTKN